ncbi:hypothetical protein F1645_03450 [Novacetimonas hansenii]|uniref:Transmembrane protein n=1 Tax=Novacetimonas hansenii TaxID=436 RepID=A0AAW5ENH6_NOVHA|nr:hypothetical protein [Novacetimonas hansenii]MCJ8353312.1 hypothetical protein [Novacetimonas hansenii]
MACSLPDMAQTMFHVRQAVPESTIRTLCFAEHVYFIIVFVPSWRFMFSALVFFVTQTLANPDCGRKMFCRLKGRMPRRELQRLRR